MLTEPQKKDALPDLRLVFFSHVDPLTPGVAGLRLWRFAQELATCGHRVLLICEGQEGKSPGVEEFRRVLATHDWHSPLLLTCTEDASHARHKGAAVQSSPLRRLATLSALVLKGGVFWRWRKSAEVYFDAIRETFQPHLCYATFGNLDALMLARNLSRCCSIPWVMDIKDPMPLFIPRLLWPLVRWRFQSATRITLNARFQTGPSRQVLGRNATVIYSGADCAECRLNHTELESPRFLLVGAVYASDLAESLLLAFDKFAHSYNRDHGILPSLHYYGGDGAVLRRIIDVIQPSGCIEIHGMIPRREFLKQCSHAMANCYIGSPRTYHHKLFELLAAGRPVIVFPRESAEALELADSSGMPFTLCKNEPDLVTAWTHAMQWHGVEAEKLLAFRNSVTWARFTGQLEEEFRLALGNGTPKGLRRAHRSAYEGYPYPGGTK